VVVVVVGRLHPQKGQAELLRAYAGLEPALRAACRLVFAGGTSPGHETYATTLYALAAELGVAERIQFLGFVENARELIGSFDILALPATRPEGLGGVLLEAMAARVPVIATSCGGTVEVVEDGATGLLVPPGDPPALSAALARLVRDPALRQAMGQAGRHTVERRFSAARMAGEIAAIYAEVLAERE
jgi:glycosyltransferase involved in cell wall biosynthesis